MEEETVEIDPLFIGMTRPPIMLGVPMDFFFLNFIFFGMGMVMFLLIMQKILFFCLLIAPLHAFGYVMTEKDPQWMRICLIKVQKCFSTQNKGVWKTNSFKP